MGECYSCRTKKTNICIRASPFRSWGQSGSLEWLGTSLCHVFSCCCESLMSSYTILATQLLSIAAVPAAVQGTGFCPLSFLALAIQSF